MVCHNGGQSGTLKHYSSARRIDLKLPAVMGFLAAYNAKSGTANINQDKTCGNVSCHGGITTPPWSTGSININTDCQTCHAQGTAFQTPEFRSLRALFVMRQRYAEAMEVQAIAAATNRSPNAVSKSLGRIRRLLLDCINSDSSIREQQGETL